MNPRIKRLNSDWEQIKNDFKDHKNIIVEPIGNEPFEKYRITYYVNGIYLLPDGRIETLGKHTVEITLHAEYPRYKPICNILTPIWHPNFRDDQICIGDIWGAGESLSDIIINIGDMIQYKSWNSFSPLSVDAAQWAMENKHLFPVGTLDLWKGESSEAKKEFEIDLFSENDEIINSNSTAQKPDENSHVQTGDIKNEFEKSEQQENDLEITPDELAGVEFVPTSQKMHNSQYSVPLKDSRINFKTIFMKGILYGLIGGIIGWLISELINIDMEEVLRWMGYTKDSLVNNIKKGTLTEREIIAIIKNATRIQSSIFAGILGGFIGAIMGLGEGIYYGSKEKAIKYSLVGLGIALAIGLFGGYIAQILYSGLLLNTDKYTSSIYLAFVRAIAWAIVGLGVGIAVGLIKPDKYRIVNCAVGGLVGGFLGGFIFNFISIPTGESDTGIIPRAIGITIMGALIGLGIGLLEQFAKFAWLKVIRGEFEGKEYLVFPGVTSIGSNGKNTIVLFKDKLIAPNHCDIILEGNNYVLVDKGSINGTLVNGMRINRHTLRQGNAIAMGNTVLMFNTK